MDGQIRLETRIVDKIRPGPYHNFALLGFADMLQLGQADAVRGWLVDNDHAAVVATIGGELVGILTIDPSNPACAAVGVAYVLPEYRRRGIFRFMLDELIKWAERHGRHQIEFDVPIQNAAAGKAMIATGASVVSQCFRIMVGPDEA